MNQRVEQIGDTCHMSSPRGGGTHVCWTAPLPYNNNGTYPERTKWILFTSRRRR